MQAWTSIKDDSSIVLQKVGEFRFFIGEFLSVTLDMKLVLLFSLFIGLPVALSAQQIEPDYKVYNVKQQKIISLTDLVKDFKKYDVLFFGEDHNDSTAHILEAELYKNILQTYVAPVLSMEMFYTDTQPILDEYLSGFISEKNFIKESRAWNNYKDYKPLIELAKTNHLMVIGANAATRYSNAVTQSGLDILAQLPPASKTFLPPLPVDTASGAYYTKFLETMGGHMGSMKIFQTQNLWDASMAWSVYKAVKTGKKVFHINGRFHSDEYLGTVAQLKKYGPGLKILTISCFSSADFKNPEWASYKNLGDYIILTNPGVARTF